MNFTATEIVSASPNVVFGVATNLDMFGQWMPNFVRLEMLSDGVVRQGTRFRETRMMFGRESTELFEITRHEPPSAVEFFIDGRQGTSGRGEYRFRYEFEPDERGTRVTLHGEIGGMPRLMRLFSRLAVSAMRKACTNDLAALRAFVERQPAALRHSTAMMPVYRMSSDEPAQTDGAPQG